MRGNVLRSPFYAIALLLMLLGAAATFVQKNNEGKVAAAGARAFVNRTIHTPEYKAEARGILLSAHRWSIVSLSLVVAAISAWAVAVWRHERQRWASSALAVLLALCVMLQMVMV